MPSVEKILRLMRASQNHIRFNECIKVCVHYFGEARINGSHCVFKTPWKGEPWVNIQDRNGYVKPYQVKQVLAAIDRLKGVNDV